MLSFLFLLLFSQQPAQSNVLQQGLIALRDGRLPDAKNSFEAVIQQDPSNAFAWVSLAETSRRMGDVPGANDAAQKAEQFGADVPAIDHALAAFYTQQGQLAHAAALEERYARSAKADAQAESRTAELYERAGDLASAERVLKNAWEQRGSDPGIAFSYAQLLLQKLDFTAAEKAVASARAAHPKDPQLILVSGVARYGERRFADAMDEFLKLIRIDPTIPQPYEFLGKMLEQAGPKLPKIIDAFQARVQSAPDDALANLVLAKAKLMANARDPAAESLLRHSIAIEPERWESHYELGVMLENKHDFKAAEEELNRSIALDAKQPMPHYHLARVYDRLGEPELAKAQRKTHEDLSNIPK